MGIVYTKDLLPGMVTESDITNYSNEVILPANTILTEKLIARLEYYSIPEISVEGTITSIPNEVENSYSKKVKNSEEFKEFKQKFEENTDTLKNVIDDVLKHKQPIDSQALTQQARKLTPEHATTIAVFDMIHNIRSYDDSTYAHCINVSLICQIMAKWLHFSEEDTNVLTLCGLMHDVGKVDIPEEIIKKPGKLTNEEFEIVKQHSAKGYELLKEQDLDERIKLSALMHHERCDGSGYPNGLQAKEIDDFAKIVAIADVYDAMTAARVYRGAQCPFKVISIFEEEGLQKYDPQYILTFLERIGSSYINNNVQLSDGRIGEIILINPGSLARPMVKVGDEYIDLSKNLDLEIEQIV